MAGEPKLSPKSQIFLDRFVSRAYKPSPKPADWEMFYDFMRVCLDQGDTLNGNDLYEMLIEAGFPQEAAHPLTIFYKQGWSLLNRPEGYNQTPTDHQH